MRQSAHLQYGGFMLYLCIKNTVFMGFLILVLFEFLGPVKTMEGKTRLENLGRASLVGFKGGLTTVGN